MMATLLMPMMGMYVTAERINEWAPEEASLGFYSGVCTKISDIRTPDGGEYIQITLLAQETEIVFDVLSTDWYYWGFTITATEPML